MRRSQGHEWSELLTNYNSSDKTGRQIKQRHNQYQRGAVGKPVQNNNVAKQADRGDEADEEGQHVRHCSSGAGATTQRFFSRLQMLACKRLKFQDCACA